MIGRPRSRSSYAQAARSLLRESVLTAVDELVRHDGWAATTIDRVAKTVGISRQTVYNEFGSRQSLAEAYILHRLDQVLDSVSTVVRTSSTLEEGFRSALVMFLDMADEPLIRTVLSGGGDRSSLTELLRQVNERTVERLASLIRELTPTVCEDDAVILADSIARLAVAHAIAPTHGQDVAVHRMVRLAQIVLGALEAGQDEDS
ncbi:TetR/AcrR family transcriptional regulator [Hoyosella sp. G463]|uniref:TetR/AcrR family transcriptional regulator n=1 Tax=Lolliginicoccus lacisalsi TaxID=2742202 RepID=A0A927JAF1_9ACTN|nr:TetR/AcrR family transcriptional regulator [Lolliginicoccus lacisalsi]MBD8505574.1 TetR/AcrR family transcriptional regulator [Lolliginicoccus lacisalsi]